MKRGQENYVRISGEAVDAPELRYTNGGVPNTRFILRSWRRQKTRGEWVQVPSTFVVIAWNDLAETAAASIAADDEITIVGELRSRTHTGTFGQPVDIVEIIASEILVSLEECAG